MKRLLSLALLVISTLLLSACGPDIEITDGIIDVQFENVLYEGSNIVVTVFITNGTDEDVALTYTEFWFELPQDIVLVFELTDPEVCGAGFDIFETVQAGKYKEYELEFTSEYIFMNEELLTTYGVTLDDLELYYYFGE